MPPVARHYLAKRTGHFQFPVESSIRVRRTVGDPQLLRECEAFLIDVLASQGTKGMDHDRLFNKACNFMLKQQSNMTLWTFEGITKNGPFEYNGPFIFYLPLSDPDVARRSKNIQTFFPHLLPKPRPTPDYAEAGPSRYPRSSSRPPSEKSYRHASPLFAHNDNNKDLPRGLSAQKRPKDKRYMRESLDAIYDKIAFLLADKGGKPQRVQLIIRVLASEYGTAPKDVLRAIADGPFYVSSSAKVSYLSGAYKTSETRSAQYQSLLKACAT